MSLHTSEGNDRPTILGDDTYDRVLVLWFRKCKDTNEIIWPLTHAWKHSYINYAGAFFGGPPGKITDLISAKAYTARKLTGQA